jgi:hypothetical protein
VRGLAQEEMLHGLQTSGDDWRVLVVDDVTVKVFSSACKLSDVTEENVSRACNRGSRFDQSVPGLVARQRRHKRAVGLRQAAAAGRSRRTLRVC